MNIAHLLLGSAREFSSLPALARGDAVHLSYRELWRKVSVMSMHLTVRFELGRGDRVAFAMTNCVEAIEVMYAVWHAGLCAVPMNAKLHAKEFAFILENSGAKLCFVTPDLADTIAEAAKEAPELKEIVDVTTRSYTFMGVGDPVAMAEAEATDPAWLFYTSGTTGRPKGATLTHRNLLAMTLNYFADVEQAAFSPAHVVPGIGLSPDKLLQGRVFSYGDAHRYRLGVNNDQIPVNKPVVPVHSYHRDGQMRVDGNYGATLGYEPNSYGEWADQRDFSEPPLDLSGYADRFSPYGDNDDCFYQPGDLYRLMSEEQKAALIENTKNNIMPVTMNIKYRHASHCYLADADYGTRLAEALGLDLDKVIELTKLPHKERLAATRAGTFE